MATEYPDRRKLYTVRSSYYNQAKHLNDVFLNLGFNYKGKILKKGTSPELWANPLQTQMLNTIEGMLTFLLEHTKTVKKWFSIAHDKNTMNIN
jgi:DNA modification methylase